MFITHCMTDYLGPISRCPQLQLILANSKINEVSLVPFRENKETCLPDGEQGPERGLPCLLVLVRSALFSSLPFISKVMPSGIKVRDSSAKLHRRITGSLKQVSTSLIHWNVYVNFMNIYSPF